MINTKESLEILPALALFVGSFLLSSIVFDIIGAIMIAGAYLFWLSSKSMMFLAYPIWIVVAIFNAAYYSSYSSDTANRNETLSKNKWIIGSIAVVLSGVILLVLNHFGQLITDGYEEYWVPGNAGLTITYFVTLSLASFLLTPPNSNGS